MYLVDSKDLMNLTLKLGCISYKPIAITQYNGITSFSTLETVTENGSGSEFRITLTLSSLELEPSLPYLPLSIVPRVLGYGLSIVPVINVEVYDILGGRIYRDDINLVLANYIPSITNLTRLLLGNNTKKYKSIHSGINAMISDVVNSQNILPNFTTTGKVSKLVKAGFLADLISGDKELTRIRELRELTK